MSEKFELDHGVLGQQLRRSWGFGAARGPYPREDGLAVGRRQDERGIERGAELDRAGDLIELLGGGARERELLRVARELLGDEIADEAGAAVEAHAVVGRAHRRLEREGDGLRRLEHRDVVLLLRVPRGGGAPHEPARAVDVHRAVGEVERDGLGESARSSLPKALRVSQYSRAMSNAKRDRPTARAPTASACFKKNRSVAFVNESPPRRRALAATFTSLSSISPKSAASRPSVS